MKKVKEEKNIFWNNNWDRNIVKDENAAELYSRLSIFWFSVIMVIVNVIFLSLGVLLFAGYSHTGRLYFS